MSDERSCIYVSTDHNADEIRTFYEIPDALARRVWGSWEPEVVMGDARVFTQALADLLPGQSDRA